MGIGRASGEDRAVKAAQQAIESPLLEVSIDGARGILFNVIGGNDMSMHEINAAAESITKAADPDANIIFGATINPEIEGEMILTVVATGFDASYFAPSKSKTKKTSQDDDNLSASSDIEDIDMDLDSKNNLDQSDDSHDFHSDQPMPNIWTMDHPDDEDSHDTNGRVDNSDEDDEDKKREVELEKPSFLRRLKKKRSKEVDGDEKDDK